MAATLARLGSDRPRAQHDVGVALVACEAARRPVLEKLVASANGSADGCEHFADDMKLAPIEFAMSYITASAGWTVIGWENCPRNSLHLMREKFAPLGDTRARN